MHTPPFPQDAHTLSHTHIHTHTHNIMNILYLPREAPDSYMYMYVTSYVIIPNLIVKSLLNVACVDPLSRSDGGTSKGESDRRTREATDVTAQRQIRTLLQTGERQSETNH
jgi:hypothetical protein